MTFDLLLKKYFIGVVLAFVALAAYFQAAGATQLIGAAFSSPASSAAPARAALAPPVSTRERPTAEPIIHRNPFDWRFPQHQLSSQILLEPMNCWMKC